MPTPGAILVLGAQVAPDGAPSAALARRIQRAAEAARRFPDALVVVCGGRRWNGLVEADVMARELELRGVSGDRIARDRLSLTTIENLREGGAIACAQRPGEPIAVVSCAWHLPRATAIARAMCLDVVGIAAHPPRERLLVRLPRALREAVMARVDARLSRLSNRGAR